MQIDGFGSILMKTIGIGVALVDRGSNRLAYRNPAFAALFEAAQPGAVLAEVCGDLDDAAIRRGLAGGAIALTVRVRRRQVALEVQIREAEFEGRQILVIECQNVSRLRETEAMIDSYASMTERRARELEREKAQVEKLLLNVMPRSVYEDYKTFGTVTPRLFEPVSVLMLDFVGFTEMAVAADPTETVSELNELFTAFDRIAELTAEIKRDRDGEPVWTKGSTKETFPAEGKTMGEIARMLKRYIAREVYKTLPTTIA